MLQRKNKSNAFLLLACFIFLSYLMFTSLFQALEHKLIHIRLSPENQGTWQMPMNAKKASFFLDTLYNESEILTSATSSLVQYSYAEKDRGLILRGLYIIATLTAGYCILLYCRRSLSKTVICRISLLSVSRGGHAPPYTI